MRKKSTINKLHIAAALTAIFVLILSFLLTGDNLELVKALFDSRITKEELWETTSRLGISGYATIVLLAMLQTLCPFLPAEPVQVLSGICYGFPIGFACCMVGFIFGATIIFTLYKLYGKRLQKYFVKNLQLDLDVLSSSQKIVLIIFLLYFLPAIPYGMICFFASGTGVRYRKYILINFLGSIPSICIGVGLGHMTISSNWVLSLCVFLVLVALLIIMLIRKDWFFAKITQIANKAPYSAKTVVKKPIRPLFIVLYYALRLYFAVCGIRIKAKNNGYKKLDTPCIVLCNHGSFIDFIFAGKLLYKNDFNFITARLYFYHKLLGSTLKNIGCFPKSMFTSDLESTKNCMRVLAEGRVLAMMPEARLSTVGTFEDIQNNTFSFLKKSAVPIYTIRFSGDYFANPKWGNGCRRGAVVEAELDLLLSAEQVKEMSADEIEAKVTERLDYNEFEWLETRPKIRYKNRKLAEGLENILSICPKCHKNHTIVTKGKKIFCEECGYLTELDERYQFINEFCFKNFADWYNWQKAEIAKKIDQDENFSLSSPVTLRHSDKTGKKLTRFAGEGVCTLTTEGLRYVGTRDGEECDILFPLSQIYRLLFGAGENFEVYKNGEIFYFVPQEKRSAVDWYIASMTLYDKEFKKDVKSEELLLKR